MDAYFLETAMEVIDLRSFSNLWFWIALGTVWSAASYRAVGVPVDLLRRALDGDAVALHDTVVLADVHARRMIHIADASGLALTAIGTFALTVLLVLALIYGVEFAQAVALLVVPLALVGGLALATARRVVVTPPEDVAPLLIRHRRIVQALGFVSVFATSLWGMWSNLNANVLGV
ncbi:component of SufBCD complex [Jannaschia sp. LMIT008]|uniref:component of SufBCD complex n=1 Tax=Jannaschia maritima TaxID=3032585 RepID=UPI002811E9A5|nr:component of SufBCD complex [Jannaschia sp. LMIT008]